MSLKLIYGPTGSGKTARAIELFLGALDRGANPVFIAPSEPDVRHFQRRILRARAAAPLGGSGGSGLVASASAKAGPDTAAAAASPKDASIKAGPDITASAKAGPDMAGSAKSGPAAAGPATSGGVAADPAAGNAGVLTGGRITTFDGLVRELGTADADGPRMVSPAERLMLLRAVIRGPGRPDTLSRSAEYEGFVRQLADLISEFKQLGVGPAQLGHMLKDWAGTDSWRRGFNTDLYRLFEEYESVLKDMGAADAEEESRRAALALASGPERLARGAVVIDGFYDFTPPQLALIEALAGTEAEIAVTLPYVTGKTALLAPARFFEALRGGAETENLEPGFEAAGVARAGKNTESRNGIRDGAGSAAAIRHIGENLFEQGAGAIDAGAGLAVLTAAGVKGQAELVAAEVLRLWRRENVRLDDIAVVTRSHGSDSLALAAAFAGYGIPFDQPAPVKMSETLAGRKALAALDLVQGGSRESFFAFLRPPLAPAAGKYEVDEFDRKMRLAGIDGGRGLLREWNRTSSAPLTAISALARAAAGGIGPLAAALKELIFDLARSDCRQAPLDDRQVRVNGRRAALGNDPVRGKTGQAAFDNRQVLGNGVPGALDNLEENVAAMKSLAAVCDDAGRLEPVLNHLLNSSAAAARTAAPERSGLAAMLLSEALRSATLRRAGGDRRRCVRLLDPHRILNQRFDVVFVCGLLEGQFPGLGASSAFLDDADRRWLRRHASLKLETRELILDKERFLFYRTLTRARKRVYLCHPYCDEGGQPTVSSLFLEDALSLFNPRSWSEYSRVKKIGDPAFSPEEAPTAGQALVSLALANTRFGGRPSPPPALLKAAGDTGLKPRLAAAIERSGFIQPRLGGEVKEILAAREHFKVTELETYLKCPFLYFIERLINPMAMEADAPAIRRGLAAHRILSRFIRIMKKASIALPLADKDQLRQANKEMERLIGEELPAAAGDLNSLVTGIDLDYHLRRFIGREHRLRQNFEPYTTEWSFGICEGKPTGPYDEGTMLKFGDVKLCGRIDRVDIRPGTNQAIVIDYKTSKDGNLPSPEKFEEKGILQVPLYMMAVRDIWGLEPVGGEYYGIIGAKRRGVYLESAARELGRGSPELNNKDFIGREQMREVLDRAERQAREAAAGIRAGSFDCAPRDRQSCGYCGWGFVCQHEKREAAAVAAP